MSVSKTDIPLLRSLLTLASVIEARDPYTGGHIWRVSRYARTLAEALGLDKLEIFRAELGGLVHDLGKIGIPDAVLSKPGRLDPAEYAVIRRHSELGRELIFNHPLAPLVMDAIHYHHERADGHGYPAGLAADKIPMSAKLITVADAFDAMTSVRPYHSGRPLAEALKVIEEEQGKQFDAELAKTFLELGRKGKLSHILGHCGEARLMLACPKCGPVIAPPAASADGSSVICPSCDGQYLLHADGDTFDLETAGEPGQPRLARPDLEAVEEFLTGRS
ncbi:MAG: HD domain-containing phosphohydrolase [Elusimicrobiales bacterium]